MVGDVPSVPALCANDDCALPVGVVPKSKYLLPSEQGEHCGGDAARQTGDYKSDVYVDADWGESQPEHLREQC